MTDHVTRFFIRLVCNKEIQRCQLVSGLTRSERVFFFVFYFQPSVRVLEPCVGQSLWFFVHDASPILVINYLLVIRICI